MNYYMVKKAYVAANTCNLNIHPKLKVSYFIGVYMEIKRRT